MTKTLLTCALAALLLACGASFPRPNDQAEAATQAVGAAQAGGAANVPEAKLHLVKAQEDIGHAKELMDKDNDRAAHLLVRASAEAELALSLSQQAQAEADAQQTVDQLNKLLKK
jgi:hypothetical protein